MYFLDNDLYKFTMQYFVLLKFPREIVRYKFHDRGGIKFPVDFAKELKKTVEEYARTVILTREEKLFLCDKCKYLSSAYIDFLQGYRFDPEEVYITQTEHTLHLSIEGYWYRTILWEVVLMFLISELYFKMTGQIPKLDRFNRKKIVIEKYNKFMKRGISFSDFGTRRRFSYQNHDEVLSDFLERKPSPLIGTSNLHFAMKYNLEPIGTMAHELFMFMGAKYGYQSATIQTLHNWVDVFQGDLGVVLPDTFTTEVFLRDFKTLYAKLFDATRQDSGNPINFLWKVVQHYVDLRIDPSSKSIVFSDALNIEKVLEIDNVKLINKEIKLPQFKYGIGTFITNNIGIIPLNMVIKLSYVLINNEWVPAVKLSDDIGKNTGDPKEVKLCKQTLRIK